MKRALIAFGAVALLAGAYYAVTRSGGESARQRGLIFVSNYKENTVSVVDDAKEKEVHRFQVGSAPDGIAVRQDDPLVCIVNGVASEVTFINPLELEIEGTVPVGVQPEDAAFGRDGTLLFVTSTGDRVVNVIDVAEREPFGEPIAFEKRPRRIVASPDGKRVYVLLSHQEGEVVAIDTTTRQITGRIAVGPAPREIDVSADGRYLFANSFDADTVTVADTQTLLPVATHTIITGYGLVVHPNKPIFYSMDSFDDQVHVFNYDTGQFVTSFSYGEHPVASTISPDGRYLYVVQEESAQITKVDTETNQAVARIAVGSEPSAAAYFAMP